MATGIVAFNSPVNFIDPYGEFVWAIPAIEEAIKWGLIVYAAYHAYQNMPKNYPSWSWPGSGSGIQAQPETCPVQYQSDKGDTVGDEGQQGQDPKPKTEYRNDKPPSKPHYDKKTGKREPEHWHYKDYNWNPKTKKWEPGKWKYGGPGKAPQ